MSIYKVLAKFMCLKYNILPKIFCNHDIIWNMPVIFKMDNQQRPNI